MSQPPPHDLIWKVAAHEAEIRHLQVGLRQLEATVIAGDNALSRRMDDGFQNLNKRFDEMSPESWVKQVMKGRSMWHVATWVFLGALTLIGWLKDPANAIGAPREHVALIEPASTPIGADGLRGFSPPPQR